MSSACLPVEDRNDSTCRFETMTVCKGVLAVDMQLSKLSARVHNFLSHRQRWFFGLVTL